MFLGFKKSSVVSSASLTGTGEGYREEDRGLLFRDSLKDLGQASLFIYILILLN